MKKLLIAILFLLISFVSFAGKETTTPSVLLLNSDKVELVSAEFIWGSVPANNTCRVTYKLWNNDRTQLLQTIVYDINGANFTALVSGFGSTLESNLETNIWQDIQNRWNLVP